MSHKRYTVEGEARIQFELEVDTADIGEGYDSGDDFEEFIKDEIEGDPVEFFSHHRQGVTVTYREDEVTITACVEGEPDWDSELSKRTKKIGKDALTSALRSLSPDAKKKIVLALDGANDTDDENDEDAD